MIKFNHRNTIIFLYSILISILLVDAGHHVWESFFYCIPLGFLIEIEND